MIKSIWYEFDNWSASFDEKDANVHIVFELEDIKQIIFGPAFY